MFAFIEEINSKNYNECIDDEDSFRKFNIKNISLDKSSFWNQTKSKNIEFELEIFNEAKKNNDCLSVELSDEIIDSLNIENLRSILKTKCRIIQHFDEKIKALNNHFSNIIKEEKERNNEFKTIIHLQKKEIEKNNEFISKIKNENKESNFPNIYMNMHENDSNDKKILENQFSGDSDVSISSKIENNEISKKWFFYERSLSIVLDSLEFKFSKLNDLNYKNIDSKEKNDFNFINVEICNYSDSSLLIMDLKLDSTESRLLCYYFKLYNIGI